MLSRAFAYEDELGQAKQLFKKKTLQLCLQLTRFGAEICTRISVRTKTADPQTGGAFFFLFGTSSGHFQVAVREVFLSHVNWAKRKKRAFLHPFKQHTRNLVAKILIRKS